MNVAMLDYDLHVPPSGGEGAPLLVLLHGRGSHKGDLTALARRLLPGGLVVTPQAPFPAAPWGYGPGWAWYRYLGEDRVVPENLECSFEALDLFFEQLWSLLPSAPGPLFLGGFSQGGTMSLAYSLARPGTVPAVINFSGFLADDPLVPVTPESVTSLRIFWGHGLRDAAVPHVLAVRGRKRLEGVGAPVTATDYDIGHWIAPEEADDASAWIEALRRGDTTHPQPTT